MDQQGQVTEILIINSPVILDINVNELLSTYQIHHRNPGFIWICTNINADGYGPWKMILNANSAILAHIRLLAPFIS